MEVDYDAVNESINESIMEDIGSMNVEEFVDSLSGDDHGDALELVTCMNGLEFSMSVNDSLDYLSEYHNTENGWNEGESPYDEFVRIVTREVDRQFEERSR